MHHGSDSATPSYPCPRGACADPAMAKETISGGECHVRIRPHDLSTNRRESYSCCSISHNLLRCGGRLVSVAPQARSMVGALHVFRISLHGAIPLSSGLDHRG